MKKKLLYVASLIFGALLGVWLSASITSPIIRADGEITSDVVRMQESIRNGTLTQSTIIKFPNGNYIETSGTWAASALIFILPCLFFGAALFSQRETPNSENPKRTITITTTLVAASLSISVVLLSEYISLISHLTQNKSTINHKSTGMLDLANIFVTGEALLGGLLLFLASGILPALATFSNSTQRSQKISAAWWLLTILLITYGLFTNASLLSA